MSLLKVLSESPDERPDAVRVAGRSLSGAALLECASAVADRIRGTDRVAIEATTSLETVVGVVGAILAGSTAIPLPPGSRQLERAQILRDTGASLVLAAGGSHPGRSRLPFVPIDLEERSSAAHPEPDPERPALILYTSGTTGAPKGVIISRRAIAAELDAVAEAWAWTTDDLLVQGLPLFHVHGLVLGVLGPLRLGCRLVHVGRFRPSAFAAARGSVYFGVPEVWSRVCADTTSARALRSARLLVSGSAALPVPVFERLRVLTTHRVVERYGMTETLVTVSARADGERRPGLAGVPLTGVETRLIDEDGATVPRDGASMGELLTRGPTLFSGYLRHDSAAGAPGADGADGADSAAGAPMGQDGWFRTGDIATIGPDGWHRIIGRATTDVITSGGHRFGAIEVEDALMAHPTVIEAAVVGTPHADLGEQVTAYVVADGVGAQELIDFVARHLAAHKRPRQVRLVRHLPRNALGKVQKTLLVNEG